MQEHIKASIIVPIYNVEPYLRDCLNSLVNQTQKDIEVLLVEDCSSDNSKNIAQEYVATYDNFTLICHANNRGVSAARNTGMKVARGDYLLFVDSDDYVAPSFCERLVSRAEQVNCDVVVCPVSIVGEKDGLRRMNDYCPSSMDAVLKPNPELADSIFCVVWNKVYRRAPLNGKVLFLEGIENEDELWWRECCLHINDIAWTEDDTPLYFYRKRPGSIMANLQGELNRKFDRSLNLIKLAEAYYSAVVRSKRPDFSRYALSFWYRAVYDYFKIDGAYENLNDIASQAFSFLGRYGLSRESFTEVQVGGIDFLLSSHGKEAMNGCRRGGKDKLLDKVALSFERSGIYFIGILLFTISYKPDKEKWKLFSVLPVFWRRRRLY